MKRKVCLLFGRAWRREKNELKTWVVPLSVESGEQKKESITRMRNCPLAIRPAYAFYASGERLHNIFEALSWEPNDVRGRWRPRKIGGARKFNLYIFSFVSGWGLKTMNRWSRHRQCVFQFNIGAVLIEWKSVINLNNLYYSDHCFDT